MQKPEIIAQNTDNVVKKPIITYDSNPFTLVFNALGRIFDTNLAWVIGVIVLYGVYALFSFVIQIIPALLTPSDNASAASDIGAAGFTAIALIGLIVFLVFTVFALMATAIQIYVMGLLSYVALRSEEGKTAGFSEALTAVNQRYVRLFLAQNFAWIKIFLWTLLFIIPGIIASLRYTLLVYVIMSEPATSKGVSASHTRARSITKGSLIEIFAVSVVAGILPVINYVAALAGGAAQYRQMAYYTDHKLNRPKTHWSNWLIFGATILLASLFIIIMMAIYTLIAIYASK